VYKCLTWGSVQECMQYLLRRAVENSGGTVRMKDGYAAYLGELKRRMGSVVRLRT
jgi:proline dehydrogenase